MSTNRFPRRDKLQNLIDAVLGSVLGYDDQVAQLVYALVAEGHVSALGDPGTAKTRTMKAIMWAFAVIVYHRQQMVPDLMPADMLGCEVYNKNTGKFRFRPGPLNSKVNLFHADELNRTTPKTQAALLEAMEEGQVSTPKGIRKLHKLFMLLATQNPIDTEGTYPLPAAQKDRFAIQLIYNRLTREQEYQIAKQTTFNRHGFEERFKGVITIEDILEIREEIKGVKVADNIFHYANDISFATRAEACPEKLQGWFKAPVSIRATQWMIRLARVRAYHLGRAFVTPDDVKFVAPAVLRHRLYMSEEALLKGATAEEAVKVLLESVPIHTDTDAIA